MTFEDKSQDLAVRALNECLRRTRRLSVKQLGVALGLRPSTLYSYVSGDRKPSFKRADDILHFAEEILGGIEIAKLKIETRNNKPIERAWRHGDSANTRKVARDTRKDRSKPGANREVVGSGSHNLGDGSRIGASKRHDTSKLAQGRRARSTRGESV